MQLIAPTITLAQSVFLCLSIFAKTNRLFFTIDGPDGGGALLQVNSGGQDYPGIGLLL